MRDHITCNVSMCSYVKNKRNSAKSMDYSQKRKLNINHGNGYVLISLVITKYEQKTWSQNTGIKVSHDDRPSDRLVHAICSVYKVFQIPSARELRSR